MVGVGTVVGNGCTSGHGICGVTTLRIRSIVATSTFILSGMIVSTLNNSSQYASKPFSSLFPVASTSEVVTYAVIGLALATCGSLFVKKVAPFLEHSYAVVLEAMFGASFGTALVLSGMVNPSSVFGFLDLNNWNPLLMLVMGSSLAIALPLNYFIDSMKQPIFNDSFAASVYNSIDRKLIFGSAVFGAGWGLSGCCPGPLIVNFGRIENPTSQMSFTMLLLGMWSGQYISHFLDSAKNSR